MRKTVVAWVLALVAFGVEGRELYWRELAVRAELQDDGELRVVERHAMVFTGDWNGGERRFRVEPHQRLAVYGVRRGERALEEGTVEDGALNIVDRYAMFDDETLRWRSRDPGSPVYDRTELVYTIEYSLENILIPDADPRSRRYVLDHDFAFADRPGAIEKFSLELVLDDGWHSADGRVLRREATNLLPGKSFVMKVPLEFHGQGSPAAMGYLLAMGKRFNPWIVPVPMLLALALFLWRERRRTAAIEIDEGAIDAAWVERNVLAHRPEVAGAFLHGDVGRAEVAAMLARMEQEGKIRTWLTKTGITKPKRAKPVLHLELLVPLKELRGAEHALAFKLFLTHTETNTRKLKEAYRESGFDPPSIIRDEVLSEARTIGAIYPNGPGNALGATLILAGIGGVIASAVIAEASDLMALFLILFGGIFLAILGVPAAKVWSATSRASGLVRLAAMPLLAGAAAWLAGGIISLAAMLSLAAAWLGIYLITLSMASSKLSPEAMVVRKTMQRAREYFARQLREPKPAIRDEWTPWLIALGLDESLTSWWKAHGGEAATASSMPSAASSSSSWSSSSASSPAFSGGGGGFGGAGATGAWGTATMALATPISGASSSSSSSSSDSSSSSSSSSSDSSSGGGGGGGW
jgi:hypothetical protein